MIAGALPFCDQLGVVVRQYTLRSREPEEVHAHPRGPVRRHQQRVNLTRRKTDRGLHAEAYGLIRRIDEQADASPFRMELLQQTDSLKEAEGRRLVTQRGLERARARSGPALRRNRRRLALRRAGCGIENSRPV